MSAERISYKQVSTKPLIAFELVQQTRVQLWPQTQTLNQTADVFAVVLVVVVVVFIVVVVVVVVVADVFVVVVVVTYRRKRRNIRNFRVPKL